MCAWIEWKPLAIGPFQKVTAVQGDLERAGVGVGRPVEIIRNSSNLTSSAFKRGWGDFGNGQRGIVARNIVKGKFNRSL